MFIILICAYCAFYLIRYDYQKNFLRAIIDSGVIFSSLTVFCAEFLSIFNVYRSGPVFSFWVIVIIVCLFAFRSSVVRSTAHISQIWTSTYAKRHNQRNRNKPSYHWLFPQKQSVRKTDRRSNNDQTKQPFGWLDGAALVVIALFCIGTLATALMYPPTNYDSHVYHLPRIFYWMKNGTVHNFPTNVARQLYVGPFNAFVMLQTMVLSHGKDLLLNTSQWFCYVGSIIASALIAAELGLKRRWQIVSALLAATIPMSILQASTTQNDLMAAFWCAVSVYYTLRLINDRNLSQLLDTGVLTGLSVGIAVLTKATSLLALAPFAIMIICLKLRKQYWKKFAYTSGVVICCAIIICAGFFIRNAIDLNGDFLAVNAPESSGTRVTVSSPNYRLALMAKNLLYNFGSQSQPLSEAVYNIADATTSFLGVDLNDPSITLYFNEYITSVYSYSYDIYPTPLHSLLGLLATLMLLVYYFKNKSRFKSSNDDRAYLQFIYSGACIASFCIVAANFLWCTSAPRYMLPSFLIATPFCAAALAAMKPARIIAAPALIIMVYFGAGPLLFNGAQPLIINPLMAHNRFGVYMSVYDENATRQNIIDLLLLSDDTRFMDTAESLIVQNDITHIGIYQGAMATYPILSRFFDESYEVSQIDTAFKKADCELTFTPQAIFAVIDIDNDPHHSNGLSPIEFNGITYMPVLASHIGYEYAELMYVLFLDETFGFAMNDDGANGIF